MESRSGPYSNWHEVLTDPRFSASSEALRKYLILCEGVESPTPYHIWSFISLLAALAGDRLTLSNGPMGRERLNLGIVLTGIPAIRKSSALTLMQKFAQGLPVSYGPTDTAGQRQGIMSAMLPRWQKDSLEDNSTIEASLSTLEELAMLDTDGISVKLENPLERKASEIYFVSKELGRLIASNSRELFDFFTDGLDGETFHYQLKSQTIKIHKPLMNLLGATTPGSLGTLMPRGGDTHGFLSRLIFVHAATVERAVPIPKEWDDRQLSVKGDLHQSIHEMLETQNADISLTEGATETFKDLYGYCPSVMDIRLQAYSGRRAKHLLKIAALLGIMREPKAGKVIASDMRLAHALLVLTETTMDRAFFGLDQSLYARVLCAVAELIEGSSDGSVSMREIQSQAGHLAPKAQLFDMLESLVIQKKLESAKSTGDDNSTWRLQSKNQTVGLGLLRVAFRAGGIGEPQPDEFRTHKVGVEEVKNKKGSAG